MDATRFTPSLGHVVSRQTVLRGVTLFVIVAAGLVAPTAALAHDSDECAAEVTAEYTGITQNQLSILLIESKEAPGGVLAGSESLDFAQTPNERSIAMAEDKLPPGGVLAGEVTPDFALTANGRSIALIEGQDPANFPISSVASGAESED